MDKVTNLKTTGLRRTLKAEGRSVAWLARATGYSQGYVHHVLSGRAPWTPDFQAKVAEALGTEPGTRDLYRGMVVRIPENIYRKVASLPSETVSVAYKDAWKRAWVEQHGSEFLAVGAEHAWTIAASTVKAT